MKNLSLIFRAEDLSRCHVTKPEANKHGDINFIECPKL